MRKTKSSGNSNDLTAQITGQNDDNVLGIPRANFRAEHYVYNFSLVQLFIAE